MTDGWCSVGSLLTGDSLVRLLLQLSCSPMLHATHSFTHSLNDAFTD